MQNNDLPKWQTVKSVSLINDRWLKLRADTCITPDGKTISPWYVLEYPEWVNCPVIDRDENVILLQHYRQGAGEYVQEIIGGILDPHETQPEATIARELKEEIGYESGQVYKTGISYANPSSQNNKVHSFLAVGGSATTDILKEHGADFAAEKVPFDKFVAQITDPTNTALYQGLHLASIFFAFNFISHTTIDSEAIARLKTIVNS